MGLLSIIQSIEVEKTGKMKKCYREKESDNDHRIPDFFQNF